MKGNSIEKGTHDEDENEILKQQDKAREQHDVSSAEHKDLDTGWAWVVLFASFGTFCLLGTSLYSVGIIQSVLLQKYKESITLTSWPGAVNTALMSLGGKTVLNVLISLYLKPNYTC
jgi:hypothetical protein